LVDRVFAELEHGRGLSHLASRIRIRSGFVDDENGLPVVLLLLLLSLLLFFTIITVTENGAIFR
tara:strand:+ start:646 stop:837 length:192 start_codon:yes stop_codon:yes gene_type:complete